VSPLSREDSQENGRARSIKHLQDQAPWHAACKSEIVRRTQLSGDAAGSEVDGMPVISKFYGIVIGMFVAPAFSARFHAIYGDSELVVAINPLRIIDGHAPQRVCDLVMEWAAQHQRELLEAWNRLTVAQAPPRIAPLQ
jgi:hypothetical protein